MSIPKGNILIGQSGGPTAVINQSLVGLIERAREDKNVRGIYGALHGIRGLLEDKLVDLRLEKKKTLEAVAHTPGAALGSVRKKPTPDECARAVEQFKKHDVRAFFYIGGNDSAETAHLLEQMTREAGHEMALYHVPKTIDNDLRETDHCPGYGSAAKYVACCLMGDNEDTRSLPGVKLDVIMGRNAGWLTAATALARVREDDGPHLIYVPERDFSYDAFARDVREVFEKLGRCVVAVSEGIHGPGGKPLIDTNERDGHGNLVLSGSGALGDRLASELKQRIGDKLRVRADTFGYAQRSFAGLYSKTDAEEAREVGREAARIALKGKAPSGSIAIVREKSKKQYRVRYERVELAKVAKVTRPLDERFLAGEHDVSADFLEYVRPLVGKLPKLARLERHPL